MKTIFTQVKVTSLTARPARIRHVPLTEITKHVDVIPPRRQRMRVSTVVLKHEREGEEKIKAVCT